MSRAKEQAKSTGAKEQAKSTGAKEQAKSTGVKEQAKSTGAKEQAKSTGNKATGIKRHTEESLASKEKRRKKEEAKKKKEKTLSSKQSLEEDIVTAIRTANQTETTDMLLENEISDICNSYYPTDNACFDTHYERSEFGLPDLESSVLSPPNRVPFQNSGTQDPPVGNRSMGLLSRSQRLPDQHSSELYSCYGLASNYMYTQPSFLDVSLSKKIDFTIKKMEELTERVEKLEAGSTPQSKYVVFYNFFLLIINFFLIGSDIVSLGGTLKLTLKLTQGQYHTIKCVAKTQKWTCALRKLLAMLYNEDFLEGRYAVGKRNSLNASMDKDEMGIIKGIRKITFCSYY